MFALRSSHTLDPFLKTYCWARCSLSCTCVDDWLINEGRGGEGRGVESGILHRGEPWGWFSFCWNQSEHTAFPMHPYSIISYFSWNSMMSNSLPRIACHPLSFGAVFQSKMCSIFCYPLFIILKDSFLLPSRTSENFFYSLSTSVYLSNIGRYREAQLPECGECELLLVITLMLHCLQESEVGSGCRSAW